MQRICNGRTGLAIAIWAMALSCLAADLGTGDECVLSADGTDVFLSVSEKTHGRLTELCAAKDEIGVAQLVASGKVLVVKAGTRAKIVDHGFLVSEVRVLAGTHAGESGFVASEFLNAGEKPTSKPKAPWLKGFLAVIAPKGSSLRITAVAGKEPKEVDNILGKPVAVTPIENAPADMPGEFRDYKRGRLRVVVQFFRDRAVGASIDIDDPPAATAEDALRIVGLPNTALTQTFETPKNSPVKLRVIRWRGEVDGIEIENASATMSEPAAWTLVAVQFPRSLAIGREKNAADEARYTVYFKSGSKKPVLEYHEEGDDYVITFVMGGKGRYPKKMVKRFEPTKTPRASIMRTWTDNTGEHKIDAEFVAFKAGNVTLKKAGGKEVNVPLEKLSEADQAFVRSQSSAK